MGVLGGSWNWRDDPESRISRETWLIRRAKQIAHGQAEQQIKAKSTVAKTTRPGSPRTPSLLTPRWQQAPGGRDAPDYLKYGFASGNTAKPGDPILPLDSKSGYRSKMFDKAEASAQSRSRLRAAAEARQASGMHRSGSPERAALGELNSGRFNPKRGVRTLPYQTATPMSGNIPTPPRPSSGVAPRIAGKAASTILKGTGALGVVGGAIGFIAGMNDPAEALGATVDRAGSSGGGWAKKKMTPAMRRAEKAYYAKKRVTQRASNPLLSVIDRRR